MNYDDFTKANASRKACENHVSFSAGMEAVKISQEKKKSIACLNMFKLKKGYWQ